VLAQTAVARRLGALSPRFATSFSTASLAVAGLLGRGYPVERAFYGVCLKGLENWRHAQ